MGRLKKYRVVIFVAFVACVFIKVALAFILFGSVIVYAVIASLRLQKKLSIHGVECTGKIMHFETDRDGDKTPVIEFTPIGGTVITAKPFLYATTDLSKLQSHGSHIGTEVPVTYDPDDPIKFILTRERGFTSFIFSLFFLGGLFFVGIGVADLLGFIRLGH